MDIRQALVMAVKSLLARKVRSLLTMLGVIVGVAAVIAIMTIGRGTLAQVEEQFEHLGANMITVNIYSRDSTRQISVEDMYALVEENPDLLCDLSPSVGLSGGIKYGNTRYGKTAVAGVGEDYPKTQLLELAEGNFLQYMDVERRSNVCVVGSYVAEKIMGGQALGNTLKIRGRNYTVIGVLIAYDEFSVQNGEGSVDDIVYIPYSNVLKMGETAFVSNYTLNSVTRDCSEAAVAAIEAELLDCYASDDYFKVVSQKERMAMLLAMQNSMLSVLSAIAGIALLVGGVGIMNIMSVSVSERTREIGVRKSFGARKRDIRLQFIIEAGSTSAVGGLLGLASGLVVSLIACWFRQLPFQLAPDAMLLSFGVSVGLGVVFGFLPANRAARLEPIDALRYD